MSWFSWAYVFRVQTISVQYHPNGSSTNTDRIRWFGICVKKVIRKYPPPKYGEKDPIPFHDVDKDCESDSCMWMKAQNKIGYAALAKYNRKAQPYLHLIEE